MISRAPWIIGLTVATSLSLVGCTAAQLVPPTTPVLRTDPTPTRTPGSLGAGFWDSPLPPVPEGTITPAPLSWANAVPPAGYTAVLLSYGTDTQTRILASAVRSWAKAEHVQLEAVTATGATTLLQAVDDAVALKPDLIISVGNAMVDPLAAITPVVLDQEFLVVGAEIAEPTYNVTAADWTGASFRGEGLGTPSAYNPKSFTKERAGRALRAGVAAVLNNLSGIVVWVD